MSHPLRAADRRAIEDLLGLLARAVQQLHTYPSTSPLCTAAIEGCHRALAALDGCEHLRFLVTPVELIVDDAAIGGSTIVGRELARRLHRASVSGVTIDRAASVRELARFCEDLVRSGDGTEPGPPLAELIAEHGIERISIETAHRPEVLEVRPLHPATTEDLARERARFDAQLAGGEAFNYLYPPHKGWVRLDPASAPDRVSLRDLAVLADDPAALAAMLLRLTDEGFDDPSQALQKKYSDVALLISSLEPRTARRLFAKLARAVLDLEPEDRRALLRRAVLPGLLDSRVDGAVLRYFPDVDLAESLCLLLDLEAAAPELLSAALARLDLPAERHEALLPLLDARLQAREAGDSGRHSTLARHARELVRVDGTAPRSFAELSSFDLAMDDEATAALADFRACLPATDACVDQLTCLWHLIALEPNPEMVGRFLTRSFALLSDLERSSRGGELPAWLGRYREFAESVRETRPDVSDVIAAHLTAFCTPARAAWIADLSLREPGGREAADAVIEALGTAVAAPLVAILEEASQAAPGGAPDSARAIAHLLTAHIRLLGPAVAPLLDEAVPYVRRALLRALGEAGPGYEDVLARFVSTSDEPNAREALRSLARLGTAKAAARVAAAIVSQAGPLRLAAEETLWHFPLHEAQRHARELLGRREFAMRHPDAAERLLDRATRTGAVDLGPALHTLAPMRFRIWNPALARVARKAHRMLRPAPATAGVVR